jgi:PKD repeat protein
MKRYLAILVLLLLISTASAANLFNYSEQINTTPPWTRSYVYKFLNDTQADPNGDYTADTYNVTTGLQNHYVGQAIPVTSGLPYTMSAYFKPHGTNKAIQLTFASAYFGSVQYTNANISSCAITVTSEDASNSATAASGGWCRISHTAVATSSGNANAFFFFTANNTAAGRGPEYDGAGYVTEAVAIWGMQAEQASSPSDYGEESTEESDGGWASFTPTTSDNLTVFGTGTVQFTNTHTAGSPTGYLWQYRNVTGDNVLRTFSTSASPSYTFQAPRSGAWNYSIALTVTNATGSNTTLLNSHFVNVTRWNQTGTDVLPLLPASHIARYNISLLGVHASSNTWINSISQQSGGNTFKVYQGTTSTGAGKKIMYVGSGVPMVPVAFTGVLTQSDVGESFAWPDEGWWDEVSGDGNMYVYNRDTGLGYEFSRVGDSPHPDGIYANGTHGAGTGNIYDYSNLTVHRPIGTSAGSVSGMQRIPLILTYADINSSSVITHGFEASYGTVNAASVSDVLWPASATTTIDGVNASWPKMGARFRLKNTTDLSHLQSSHPAAYKVAVALRDYGAFLNIRSSAGLRINGEVGVLSDTDNAALQSALPVTAFEFVDESSLMVAANSYVYDGYVPGVAPVANFTTADTSIVVNGVAHFVDSSANNPTSWQWDIIPAGWTGGQYQVQNPDFTFYHAGIYTVNLTVTNENGTSTLSRPNYITVATGVTAPVAAFSCSPVIGYSPLSVACGDTSSNTPTSWYWDLGDGNTSTSQNPSHTYATPGSYTVRLNATNAGGFDWENKTGYIAVNAPPVPVTDFYADNMNVTVGGTVQFYDYSTNSPTSWTWYIYDSYGGDTVTTQNPSHTYLTLGNYSVTLTATNAYGPDTETKTNYIHVIAGIPEPPTPTPTPTVTSAPPHDDGYSPHMRSMAVETIATIPTERYNAIMGILAFTGNETTDTPNFSALPPEIIGTYTDYMGPIALLIVFLIPFGMIWMSHGNMKLLSILGFITCLFVFWYLPANYAYAAWICMGISCVGFMWGLWKQ